MRMRSRNWSGMLRATEEWRYVEREVDIRMERERLDAG